MMDNFLFVDLSATDARLFDGMAAGAFTDMRGRKVKFDPAELPEYIENSMDVLESTRTEGGELVGLPIDADGHDHKGGAGWITGFELDPARNVIRFASNWTEAGTELIKNNTRRFFSPTVDVANKVILGGSLTNWPATRDPKGRMLLRPIELSQELQEIEMDNPFEGLLELGREFLAELKGRKQTPPESNTGDETMGETMNVAEFMQTPEAIAELEKRASERANELLKAEQFRAKVKAFALKATGDKQEYGLAINADELETALLALPVEALDLIEKITDAKIANFAERGTGGQNRSGKEVPAEIKPFIKQWVEAGKTAESFFEANPELGAASDYELGEFVK